MLPTVKVHSGLSPYSYRPCRAHNETPPREYLKGVLIARFEMSVIESPKQMMFWKECERKSKFKKFLLPGFCCHKKFAM